LGLNYKFVGTDRSVSQIGNPGVTPGFSLSELTTPMSAYGPKRTLQVSASGGLMSKIAQFFH